MAERLETELGRTVLGRPIMGYFFGRAPYAAEKPTAILFGAIHGDEPLGVFCLANLMRDLLAEPPGRDVWIIPALNEDGLAGGCKNNGNDCDLNRNFASKNWSSSYKSGYFPGQTPESEPETRLLVDLINTSKATRLIALHSPFRTVNWDGTGEVLATAMAERNGYGATADVGYPTPGSLGSKYGIDLGYEVITLEIPFMSEEQAWQENRAALRFAVDLP